MKNYVIMSCQYFISLLVSYEHWDLFAWGSKKGLRAAALLSDNIRYFTMKLTFFEQ
jgi:hypothetical protein